MMAGVGQWWRGEDDGIMALAIVMEQMMMRDVGLC